MDNFMLTVFLNLLNVGRNVLTYIEDMLKNNNTQKKNNLIYDTCGFIS